MYSAEDSDDGMMITHSTNTRPSTTTATSRKEQQQQQDEESDDGMEGFNQTSPVKKKQSSFVPMSTSSKPTKKQTVSTAPTKRPTSSSSSSTANKAAAAGKTTKPPAKAASKSTLVTPQEIQDDNEEDVDMDLSGTTGRGNVFGETVFQPARKGVSGNTVNGKGTSGIIAEKDLRNELVKTQKLLQSSRKENTTLSEKLDTIVTLQEDETQKLFDEYRAESEKRSEHQRSVIALLQEKVAKQALEISRLQQLPTSASSTLTTSTAHHVTAPVAAPVPAKVSELDKKIKELEKSLKDSELKNKSLRKDLQTETTYSKQLQSQLSSAKASSAVAPTSSQPLGSAPMSSAVEATVLTAGAQGGLLEVLEEKVKLYEELTDLAVTDYKMSKDASTGAKEKVFSCLFVREGRSLYFKLTYKRVNTGQKWIEGVTYHPLNLESEPDKEWIKNLDFMAKEFTAERIEGWGKTLYGELRDRVGELEEDDGEGDE